MVGYALADRSTKAAAASKRPPSIPSSAASRSKLLGSGNAALALARSPSSSARSVSSKVLSRRYRGELPVSSRSGAGAAAAGGTIGGGGQKETAPSSASTP